MLPRKFSYSAQLLREKLCRYLCILACVSITRYYTRILLVLSLRMLFSIIMLAIDFPGKKRIFTMNHTTWEIIRDIFKKMETYIFSLSVSFILHEWLKRIGKYSFVVYYSYSTKDWSDSREISIVFFLFLRIEIIYVFDKMLPKTFHKLIALSQLIFITLTNFNEIP